MGSRRTTNEVKDSNPDRTSLFATPLFFFGKWKDDLAEGAQWNYKQNFARQPPVCGPVQLQVSSHLEIPNETPTIIFEMGSRDESHGPITPTVIVHFCI
jgi:hypothetical protein